ncbi:hypothetical protein AQS8620_01483 [Aquimixticola soesokkakensis]|uniref:Uncharacterized protein n=2 Tax=Aquimixticola soesokkakensis TaxID=1519096 RepID=A0A1Y5SG60_9RHOB|nr:hypothetical protein AQS8620_01483 [Aquimixticola soesokkakensis]
MGKFLGRLVLVIVVAGLLGLIGYGYLGNLSANQSEVRVPVTLEAQ